MSVENLFYPIEVYFHPNQTHKICNPLEHNTDMCRQQKMSF